MEKNETERGWMWGNEGKWREMAGRMEPDGALDAALEFVYDFIIIADKFFELFLEQEG